MLEINKIHYMDAIEGLKQLEKDCIDLVITDPPYIKESVDLYGKMAKELKRVMKEGTFCFAYCGAQFLPEVIRDMSKYLEWFWLFEIKHNGGYPRFWSKKLMVGCKPVVVFTKGKPKELKWLSNIHTSETQDKRYHKWGQSMGFPIKIIETLTNKNQLVLDPFMGGGTVAYVCEKLQRKYIGFELDVKQQKVIESRQQQKGINDFQNEEMPYHKMLNDMGGFE